MADPEEKIASVIVPDYQLSLAIGKEGQNARLAARLTGYKIDIKSETQAIEAGELPENYMEEMGLVGEEGYTGDYEEEYNEEYSEESYDEAAEDQNEESEEIEFIETILSKLQPNFSVEQRKKSKNIKIFQNKEEHS